MKCTMVVQTSETRPQKEWQLQTTIAHEQTYNTVNNTWPQQL